MYNNVLMYMYNMYMYNNTLMKRKLVLKQIVNYLNMNYLNIYSIKPICIILVIIDKFRPHFNIPTSSSTQYSHRK